MKKLLLPLVGVAALASFQTANAATGEELFKSKPCVACHKVDVKIVGPSLQEVSAKYKGQDGAIELVAKHIKEGSSGIWGPIPMPPNPVTVQEATTLAKWVIEEH